MTSSRLPARIVDVETSVGLGRLWYDDADRPRARLVLGHGAGGGPAARDLDALARRLPASDITVVRVEQPWRVAGRKVAAPVRTLDTAWLELVAAVSAGAPGEATPVVFGGRSSGARVACRTASSAGAVAVVALAFPLVPPGKTVSRIDELTGAGVPTVVVQGDRDPFGAPAAFPPGPYQVVTVPGGDHGFAVRKGQDQAAALDVVVSAALAAVDRAVA